MTDEIVPLWKRYLQAQLAGDRREAVRVVMEEGLGVGLPVAILLIDVIQRAQHEIGRLWQQNRISVADEHLATAISQLAMAHLFQAAPRPADLGRRVVLACVEGEWHDMGVRVAADMLEMEGFQVRCLGANVPTDSLLSRLRDEHADAVLLSATMTFNLPALRAAVDAVRDALPGLPVLAGGRAFEWSPTALSELELPGPAREAGAMVRQVRAVVGL